MIKRDGRHLGRDVLAHIRLQAVREIRHGESPEAIARRLGFCRQIIYKWLRRARDAGLQALRHTPAPGARPRLTPAQIRQLKKDVQRSATEFGFVSDLWTVPRLRTLIRQQFQVTLSRSGLWEFLRREGVSPQRPLKRALERDEAAIRRWVRLEYPRIRAEARKHRAILHFGDESGVRTDHVSGRTWALRGHTPEVSRTSRRTVVNLLSAMTPRGELLFMTSAEKVNSEIFIRFLRKVLAHHRGRRIVLIVDRRAYHCSRKTRDFVAKHRQQLRLEYLPANAPELNPDEHVWGHLKGSGATDSTTGVPAEVRHQISLASPIPSTSSPSGSVFLLCLLCRLINRIIYSIQWACTDNARLWTMAFMCPLPASELASFAASTVSSLDSDQPVTGSGDGSFPLTPALRAA